MEVRKKKDYMYVEAKTWLNKLKIEFMKEGKKKNTIKEGGNKEKQETNEYNQYFDYMCKFRWYEIMCRNDKNFQKYIKCKYNNVKLEDRNLISEKYLEGKDICNFSFEEIHEMLRYFSLGTMSSINTHISVLKNIENLREQGM